MDNKYTIEEILKGCLRKQSRYQRALVDQYSGMLLVICKRYLNDNDLAKDLVQDSLMKIFKNLDKYDSKLASFESWISTITIRLCLSSLSKNKLRVINAEQGFNASRNFSVSNLENLETEYLLKMIMELPGGYREVFNLYVIDGFSHDDIADMLNISKDLCRARLSRAKKILRKKIDRLKIEERWVNSI